MKTIRWAGIALLFFLAASAIVGSVPMLTHPDGEPWKMPQAFLQHSPFASYLIPGIILLTANGLPAAWVLWLALARSVHYGRWMAFQGCVLFGWLAVECVVLRLVIWPHLLYGAVAVALMAAGVVLWRAEDRSSLFSPGEGI